MLAGGRVLEIESGPIVGGDKFVVDEEARWDYQVC